MCHTGQLAYIQKDMMWSSLAHESTSHIAHESASHTGLLLGIQMLTSMQNEKYNDDANGVGERVLDQSEYHA